MGESREWDARRGGAGRRSAVGRRSSLPVAAGLMAGHEGRVVAGQNRLDFARSTA